MPVSLQCIPYYERQCGKIRLIHRRQSRPDVDGNGSRDARSTTTSLGSQTLMSRILNGGNDEPVAKVPSGCRPIHESERRASGIDPGFPGADLTWQVALNPLTAKKPVEQPSRTSGKNHAEFFRNSLIDT